MTTTWDYGSGIFGTQPTEEQVWVLLRLTRNTLLRESDWTQANDAPVDKTAWAEYRQALRDLPAKTSDPRQATWPTQPDA